MGSTIPTVSVANLDHGSQDLPPCTGPHHSFVREHAAVPTDVFKGAGEFAVLVAHPIARDARDVELTHRIAGKAVTSGRIVRTGSEYRCVILRHMKIDGPGPQQMRHLSNCIIQNILLRPIESRRYNPVLRGVEAERVKQRVGHVGLEAERSGTVHHFEKLSHVLPAMHATPANFSLCREPFAMALGNGTCFPKRLRDTFCISRWILDPVPWAGCRVDTDNAVFSNSQITQFVCDRTSLADLNKETLPIFIRAHGGAAAGGRPHWRDDGTDDEAALSDVFRETLEIRVSRIDVHMRRAKK